MNQLRSIPSDGLEELIPIREVSRLTGVNPVTLRAWERRYGLITPTRTEGGHRLYSFTDVETVRTILMWIERGVAVGKVGKILAGVQVSDEASQGFGRLMDSSGHQAWQLQIRQAVNDFDEPRLDQVYGQIFSFYPLTVAFEDVLMPVWHDLALRHASFGQASEWLFLDSFLRARVLQRLQRARGAGTQRVLMVAMPGECLELELWVAALAMSAEHGMISVLAMGQPLEELSLVCSKMEPDALVLYSNQAPASDLRKRLMRLGSGLKCPLYLAGKAADIAQEELEGTFIGLLGSDGLLMQRRLQQFLVGQLDT